MLLLCLELGVAGCSTPRHEDPCAGVLYGEMQLFKSKTDGSVVPFAEAELCAGDCLRFGFDCSIELSKDVNATCEANGQWYRLTFRTTPFTFAQLRIFDAQGQLRYEEEVRGDTYESPYQPHCSIRAADFWVNYTGDFGTTDAAVIDP